MTINPYQPPAQETPTRSRAVVYATDAGMIALILGVWVFTKIGASVLAFLYWRNRGKRQDREELEASAVACPQCHRQLGATTKICPRCNHRMQV